MCMIHQQDSSLYVSEKSGQVQPSFPTLPLQPFNALLAAQNLPRFRFEFAVFLRRPPNPQRAGHFLSSFPFLRSDSFFPEFFAIEFIRRTSVTGQMSKTTRENAACIHGTPNP